MPELSYRRQRSGRSLSASKSKTVKFSDDVLNSTTLTADTSLNTSATSTGTFSSLDVDVFDPFTSTDDNFMTMTTESGYHDVFNNLSLDEIRITSGRKKSKPSQRQRVTSAEDDVTREYYHHDPSLQLPHMSDEDDEDLSSVAEKLTLTRDSSDCVETINNNDASNSICRGSQSSQTLNSNIQSASNSSQDFRSSGQTLANSGIISNPSSKTTGKKKLSRKSFQSSRSKESSSSSSNLPSLRPRQNAFKKGEKLRNSLLKLSPRKFMEAQDRSVSTTSMSTTSSSSRSGESRTKYIQEELHHQPISSYTEPKTISALDCDYSSGDEEDEDWKKAEEEWERASHASSMNNSSRSVNDETHDSLQLSTTQHPISFESFSGDDTEEFTKKGFAPAKLSQRSTSDGSRNNFDGVNSQSSCEKLRLTRHSQKRNAITGNGSSPLGRKGGNQSRRSRASSSISYQRSTTKYSKDLHNNVLDEDDEDSILASTEEDEPEKVPTLHSSPYLSPKINKHISSLDDLETSEISPIQKKKLFHKKIDSEDVNDDVHDQYKEIEGVSTLRPSPLKTSLSNTVRRSSPSTAHLKLPTPMQRTNSRVSFAQQMDKVHHFDVPSVTSTITSNAYGKYHNGSESETDDSETDESYGDSTDTESDEENSGDHRTSKAKNAAKSSFITQNEVGDVLKDFFLVGDNTGGGSLSRKRNSCKYNQPKKAALKALKKHEAINSAMVVADVKKKPPRRKTKLRPPSPLVVPSKWCGGQCGQGSFGDEESTDEEDPRASPERPRRIQQGKRKKIKNRSCPDDESSSDSSLDNRDPPSPQISGRVAIKVSQSTSPSKAKSELYENSLTRKSGSYDSKDNENKMDVSSSGSSSFRESENNVFNTQLQSQDKLRQLGAAAQIENTQNSATTEGVSNVATGLSIPLVGQQLGILWNYVETGVDLVGDACGFPVSQLCHSKPGASTNNDVSKDNDAVTLSSHASTTMLNPLPGLEEKNIDSSEKIVPGSQKTNEDSGTPLSQGKDTLVQEYMRLATDILFPPKIVETSAATSLDNHRLQAEIDPTQSIQLLSKQDQLQLPQPTSKLEKEDAEERLVELAMSAARASHDATNLTFDETAIDVINDVSFYVLTLPLPLGLIFQKKSGGCYVSRIFKAGNAAISTPEEKVLVGDQIVSVNGESVAMSTVSEVTSLVNCSPDPSAVELTFIRYTGPPCHKKNTESGRIAKPSGISQAVNPTASNVAHDKNNKVRWNLELIDKQQQNNERDCSSDANVRLKTPSQENVMLADATLSLPSKKSWKLFKKNKKFSSTISSDLESDAASASDTSYRKKSRGRRSLFSSKQNNKLHSSFPLPSEPSNVDMSSHHGYVSQMNRVNIIHDGSMDGYNTDDVELESELGADHYYQETKSCESQALDGEASANDGDGRKKKFRMFGARSKKRSDTMGK
eukprot:CAMPEP_0194368208 /NCGR_PEP_ID=MMETSP0174-20130528/16451_1 /TAXON_ID=216777 /ORGANISM="Proboscia alata, Strain PI-D3" /LENGTH=1435 /DNA_ID=CAMNT_0039144467 /DNA_START=436 /DNA_END=4743 /DNA_ORIENTATION=+